MITVLYCYICSFISVQSYSITTYCRWKTKDQNLDWWLFLIIAHYQLIGSHNMHSDHKYSFQKFEVILTFCKEKTTTRDLRIIKSQSGFKTRTRAFSVIFLHFSPFRDWLEVVSHWQLARWWLSCADVLANVRRHHALQMMFHVTNVL